MFVVIPSEAASRAVEKSHFARPDIKASDYHLDEFFQNQL